MSDEFLWDQFCNLGEMLGDGDCDPWVGKEYKRLAIVLGVAKPSDFRKPRKNNSKQIDDFMQKRINQVNCSKCNGALKQSRKGSLTGICVNCGCKFILGKRNRSNPAAK